MKANVVIRIWYSSGEQEIMRFSEESPLEAMMSALAILSDIAAVEQKGIKAVTINVSQ